MNPADFQLQLQKPYVRENWQKLLPQLLPGVEMFEQTHSFPLNGEREFAIATARRQIGVATLADDKRVAFYEIEVAPGVQLLSNRVGLRSLIIKCIDEVSAHAVIAFFVQPGTQAYRLTYAAKESKFDGELKIQTEQTAPRRYTYVLGPDESCRTAAERFAGLTATAGLADLTEAFSVEKLNKEFFTDFAAAFECVQTEIQKRNSWNDKIAKEEAQTLLNRLLFLYFVQRKGWLNRQRDYLFRNFRQFAADGPGKTTFMDNFLRPLFVKLSTEGSQADIPGHDLPFLNGGLFSDEYGDEQQDEIARRHHEIKVCNEVFRHVFEQLLERYNFTIQEDSPTNYEVAIDPEMLGQIFEELILTSEESETEGKTKRHDTGSVYTRRPIVHYLCRDSLAAWLESQKPFVFPSPTGVGKGARRADEGRGAMSAAERIKNLLELDATEGVDDQTRAKLNACLTPDEAGELFDLLFELRACDPGVGSGAFPMGLLHELVNVARLCATRAAGKDPVQGDRSWYYNTKKRIIDRVIYGVDIQPQAVDICKLRLWLSLMVDYDLNADPDNCDARSFRKALKDIEPLPNLDFKIRCANSLVDYIHGEPVELGRLAGEKGAALPLSKLNAAKRDFFIARTAAAKRKLRLDIYDAITDLARLEFTRARTDAAGNGLALDEQTARRVAELDTGLKEFAFIAAQLRDARKMRAQAQEDALERIRDRFDDPQKPTFIWQIDFAEVFHRTKRNDSGSLLPVEPAADSGAAGARNGFDLVIGNPPYIRIQSLKQSAPHLVEHYKRRYKAASKGNFDLYVVFVERSLELLNAAGQLAFILPHKFFNAQYGEPLRKLLAAGKNLRHVVHFGDQQIFPGATNYVCLLFLAKAGVNKCHFVRADNLDHWLATLKGVGADIPAKKITAADWNFAVGKDAGLFEKLKSMPVKLGDVAEIFVGLQTSADTVFLFKDAVRVKGALAKVWSKELDQEVEIESAILKPVIRSGKIGRFWANPTAMVLFPYRLNKGNAQLLSEAELRRQFPCAWKYLSANKKLLEEREHGKFADEWWQLYPKNLEHWEDSKIMLPYMITELAAFYDEGANYFVNVTTGGFGLRLHSSKLDARYATALLNSLVLDWFLKKISTTFHGGYFAANKQYLVQLPIRSINFNVEAEKAEHDAIVGLAEQVLAAKKADPAADTQALESEIDAHVFRLYALTPAEIALVKSTAK